MLGVGAARLALFAGCERLPWLASPAPRVARVGYISLGGDAQSANQLREMQDATQLLGLYAVAVDLRGVAGLDGVLATAEREHVDALCFLGIFITVSERIGGVGHDRESSDGRRRLAQQLQALAA